MCKNCLIKRELKFEDYKNCLKNKAKILKLQGRFKSYAHNVFTGKVNKIALGFHDVQDHNHLIE